MKGQTRVCPKTKVIEGNTKMAKRTIESKLIEAEGMVEMDIAEADEFRATIKEQKEALKKVLAEIKLGKEKVKILKRVQKREQKNLISKILLKINKARKAGKKSFVVVPVTTPEYVQCHFKDQGYGLYVHYKAKPFSEVLHITFEVPKD